MLRIITTSATKYTRNASLQFTATRFPTRNEAIIPIRYEADAEYEVSLVLTSPLKLLLIRFCAIGVINPHPTPNMPLIIRSVAKSGASPAPSPPIRYIIIPIIRTLFCPILLIAYRHIRHDGIIRSVGSVSII